MAWSNKDRYKNKFWDQFFFSKSQQNKMVYKRKDPFLEKKSLCVNYEAVLNIFKLRPVLCLKGLHEQATTWTDGHR